MRISAQEEYGLRCLLQLAASKAPMTIPEVARKEGITPAYVGKLFFMLRRAKLITSSRGAKGGYTFSGDPAKVTLSSVLIALGAPPKKENLCHSFPGRKRECVHMHGSCGVRSVWNKIFQNVWRVLDSTTLADLLEEETALDKRLERKFEMKEIIPLELGGNSHVSA